MIVSPQSISKEIECDDSIFIPGRKLFPVVHLKGVGKFCVRPGCNRRIEGVVVKRMFSGIEKTYYRPAPKNKQFCCAYCRNITNLKRHNFNKSKSLMAKLNLNVIDDKKPYRELTIYLLPTIKEVIKITKKDTVLWNFLEKISRFRESPLTSPTLNMANIVNQTK